ncbi:prolyl 4-hydroxylase subunit alpha-1-like [Anopheles nili]|uniref:prolyl 4-hydroxylase subunit alpha-1-like n=1 Tax=Anopheles nili TaxID=185578 RepID=UPI00237A83C4|nr:prolyl 4-hydroxylase subunit alpha-1-like [Anopheles nili]
MVARIGWCFVGLAMLWSVVCAEPEADDQEPIKIQFDPYMELCRGTYERSPALTSVLYCWYDVRNAYGTIAPSKVEMINVNPFVALFHGILYEGEISQLQALGDSHIKRSGLTNDSWLPVFYEDHQTYTLHDRDHPVVQRLTHRVEQVTGLSCESAEDLKVIYNEAGAYIASDMDAIQTEDELRRFAYAGDRLASMLFFLSDVEEGGFTIFPKLRLTIRPRKGSAAFWYNLQNTGEPNVKMRYSNCPMLEDSKWTAKKIIHTRGNELRNPCRP